MRYVSTVTETSTELAAPGLLFSLIFRAELEPEDVALRVPAAYEAAFRRRTPPTAFGSLPMA